MNTVTSTTHIVLSGQLACVGNEYIYLKQKVETDETKRIFHDGCLTKVLLPKKPYKGPQLYFSNAGDIVELICRPIKKSNGSVVLVEVLKLDQPKALNG